MKIFWKTFTKKRTPDKSKFPTGMTLFVGHQGAGKTLSAVHYIEILKVRYPDLMLFSNIKLEGATLLTDVKAMESAILEDYGHPTVFLIDEIQNFLFSTKKQLSPQFVGAISQQRKTRKAILGTLQEFLDLDIRYRRQLRAQVQCRNWNGIQIEFWRDPGTLKYDAEKNDYSGKVTDVWLWKHNNHLFSLYDTYEVVKQSLETIDPSRLHAGGERIN